MFGILLVPLKVPLNVVLRWPVYYLKDLNPEP